MSTKWLQASILVLGIGSIAAVMATAPHSTSYFDQSRRYPGSSEAVAAVEQPGRRAVLPRAHGKQRGWSPREARRRVEQIRTRVSKHASERARPEFGPWTPRGPRNQPGCWLLSELVDGTDTVYAVTCGHYGVQQFIFKGSLAGDDFELISARLPLRFVDMTAIGDSGSTRLVAAAEHAGIWYTDDDGKQWHESSGVPVGVVALVDVRDDGHTLFAATTGAVYRSTDRGSSFEMFQSFDDNHPSRLLSPRYANQPGHDAVYLARDGSTWRLDPGAAAFVETGSYPSPSSGKGNYQLGGDARRLYVTSKGVYFVSTDNAESWSQLPGTMRAGRTSLAVSPEDPNLVIGGYINPELSWDGLQTVTEREVWTQHQLAAAQPDPRHRAFIHGDNQSVAFFYDAAGELLTIHSTDGGLYVSRREWDRDLPVKGPYPDDVYYNITLFDALTSEVYPHALMSGHQSPYDIATGTQDQGMQNTGVPVLGLLDMRQKPYGDGTSVVTADGVTGWCVQSAKALIPHPFPLYDDLGFAGAKKLDKKTAVLVPDLAGVNDIVPDGASPGARLWVAGRQLHRADWDGDALTVTTLPVGDDTKPVLAIASSAVASGRVYVLRGDAVYRSDDAGNSWVSGGSTGFVGHDECSMWNSRSDPQHIVIACNVETGRRAVRSRDGGTSFDDVSEGLPAGVKVAALVSDEHDAHVFASTGFGPFALASDETSWIDLADNDLPWFAGRHAEYVPSTRSIRFSTFGSGIWDLALDACHQPFHLEAVAVTNYDEARASCPDACALEQARWAGHAAPLEVDGSWQCECCADGGDDDDGDDDDGDGDDDNDDDDEGDDDDDGDDDDGDGDDDDDDDDDGDDDDGDDDDGDDDDGDDDDGDDDGDDHETSAPQDGGDPSGETPHVSSSGCACRGAPENPKGRAMLVGLIVGSAIRRGRRPARRWPS